mmetsp:Transcript_851/g.3338  ORF Transcript_851/g.3338 Transcript_851/m.3338 type:complete len:144 (-) Transcript_851:1294-1725(-)
MAMAMAEVLREACAHLDGSDACIKALLEETTGFHLHQVIVDERKEARKALREESVRIRKEEIQHHIRAIETCFRSVPLCEDAEDVENDVRNLEREIVEVDELLKRCQTQLTMWRQRMETLKETVQQARRLEEDQLEAVKREVQ